VQAHFFPNADDICVKKIFGIETLRGRFVQTFFGTYDAISYRDDRAKMMFAKNKSTSGT